MRKIFFILYVADQQISTDYYKNVLANPPSLEVPGMTEFTLGENVSLGLMPETGIKQLLGKAFPDPALGSGIPRAEVYLQVENPDDFHARAIAAGGRELSPLSPRGWGDRVAYSLDPDGHVVAFAEPISG